MAVTASPFLQQEPDPERRFVVWGVPWATYVALRDAVDRSASAGLRMTYLRGALEFMSPSNEHEQAKTILARLLEAWAEEAGVELLGFGSTTYRHEAKERGLEADECYFIDEVRDVPDIAIEVIVSSGLLDMLEVYRGLGVPEVWTYKAGRLTVYRLTDDGYRAQTRSDLLPALDLAHLASFVRPEAKQTANVKAYRATLRSH